MRLRGLALEAENLTPAIESLAERAWHATEEYTKELDPVFDWDRAGERTSYARLFQALLILEGNLALVYDSIYATDFEPSWRRGH